jgi:hypothetical protein
MAAYLSPM